MHISRQVSFFTNRAIAATIVSLTLLVAPVGSAFAASSSSSNITTNAIVDITPDSATQGATKVPVMSFEVTTGSAPGEKFESMVVHYMGTNRADISNVYLYQESGTISGSSFDASFDTLRDTGPTISAGGNSTLDPANINLAPSTTYKFYIVADIESDATIGDLVDFNVETEKITLNSGTWPSATDVAANGWNPTGSIIITPSVTTDEVAQIGPTMTLQGTVKVPILSFTLSNTDPADKFDWIKVRWAGTAASPNADIGNVYLYQESGLIPGSSFDSASDTLKDTTASTAGTEISLNPSGTNFSFDPQAKFYIVTDVKAGATIGDSIDFKVETNKISLSSQDWPPASEVTAETWNPSGDTVISLPTATLTVIKHVVNDDGGTAMADDWTLAVSSSNGGTGTGSAAGAESPGTSYTLQVGYAYNVAESGGPSGYAESDSSDCTIANATLGATYTCTITNDDLPGTLHVVKNLIKDNGGTAVASDFSFSVNEGDPVAFEDDGQNDIAVNAGTAYSIAETATSTYTTSYNEGCTDIHVANGGEATCTITNDDIPAPVITAETTASPAETSLVITWTTDHPATSRVIYDTVSHPTLGSAPDYGYANSTVEDATLVESHTVTVSGLSSGTTYYFRTISRGSPETVSNEFSGTTSSPAPTPTPAKTVTGGDNGAPVGLIGGFGGQVLGASTAMVPGGTGAVLGASVFTFNSNLRYGNRGNDVIELQKRLIAEGHLNISSPTGYFGPLTRAAVKKYQTAHHIAPASGFVGVLTRAVLNQ